MNSASRGSIFPAFMRYRWLEMGSGCLSWDDIHWYAEDMWHPTYFEKLLMLQGKTGQRIVGTQLSTINSVLSGHISYSLNPQ